LILSFTLLFLKLEGDTADWTSLDTLHQMCSVTRNLATIVSSITFQTPNTLFVRVWLVLVCSLILTHLVPQSLACDHSNFIANSLVGLEVEGEFWVVSLDDDLGGLLDSLRSNATHIDVVDWGVELWKIW
jgi:hypothetical protein